MIRFFAPLLFIVAALSSQTAFAQQSAAAPAKSADTWASSQQALVDAGAVYSRVEGMQVAPGLTAAPPRRVQFDYRGRPMGKGLARRPVEPAAALVADVPVAPAAPILTASAAPVAPAASTAAPALDTAPKAAASSAAKKSVAPAKKATPQKSSGWDTSGSGW